MHVTGQICTNIRSRRAKTSQKPIFIGYDRETDRGMLVVRRVICMRDTKGNTKMRNRIKTDDRSVLAKIKDYHSFSQQMLTNV